MKKRLFSLIGAAVLVTLPATARGESPVNVSIDVDRGVETCPDIRVRYDERDAERAEDSFTLAGGATPLSVRLPENSSIRVIGGSGDEFAVTVCKFARRAAELEAIRVSPDASGMAFRGPSSREWMVFLIVHAPGNAALDLEAKNGSIGVKDIAGRVSARTTNGPIDLEGCSGPLDANAENGPISLERCSGAGAARAVNGPIDFSGSRGTYKLETKNGPISVELEGNRWEGGGLDGHAVNGPLSLKISDDYRSGVRVDMAGHGPVSCPSQVCRSARRQSNEDSRSLEFGESGSDPVIRLSTENGPVSVAPAN